MDNTFDKMFFSKGDLIAGVDESGVSDIAGPLVAACVILPKLDPRSDDISIFEINESKTTPKKYRQQYAEIIHSTAIAIGIGVVSPVEIGYLQRHRSINLAMARAVLSCQTNTRDRVEPSFIMVDGSQKIKNMKAPQVAIEAGDRKSLCIASASIIAKVYRDSLMAELHAKHPHYAWDKNKGQCDEGHLEGLDKYGPILGIHRVGAWPFLPKSSKETQEFSKRRKKWKNLLEKKLQQTSGDEFYVL